MVQIRTKKRTSLIGEIVELKKDVEYSKRMIIKWTERLKRKEMELKRLEANHDF